MDLERDYWTVEAMRKYGGSFVQALAEAAQLADYVNLQKIKMAWPDYWDEYTRWGEKMREESKAEKA